MRRYTVAGIVHAQARTASARIISLCGKKHMPSRTVEAEVTCAECLRALGEAVAA